MENWEQTVIILDEKWPKHFEGAENQPKYEARFGLSMPKNPYNNLTILMDLSFSEFFGSYNELLSPTSRWDNCWHSAVCHIKLN